MIGNGGVTQAVPSPFSPFLSPAGQGPVGLSCSWHWLTAGGPNNCYVDCTSRLAGLRHGWRGDIMDLGRPVVYACKQKKMMASAKLSMSVGAHNSEVKGSKPLADIPCRCEKLLGHRLSEFSGLLSGHPAVTCNVLS